MKMNQMKTRNSSLFVIDLKQLMRIKDEEEEQKLNRLRESIST